MTKVETLDVLAAAAAREAEVGAQKAAEELFPEGSLKGSLKKCYSRIIHIPVTMSPVDLSSVNHSPKNNSPRPWEAHILRGPSHRGPTT